jgi:hypothetical protein
VCEYRRGGGCTIKLSEPLLKVRKSSSLPLLLVVVLLVPRTPQHHLPQSITS